MTTFKKICCLIFISFHCGLIIIANLSEIKNLGEDTEAIKQFSVVGQKVVNHTTGYLPTTPSSIIPKIYSHFAGTNTGYCFFSPNVPTPSTVLFELSNPDNEKLLQLPMMQTKEGQLRFTVNTNLYKSVKDLRELLAFSWAIRMLEYNPDYNQIEVIIGGSTLPSIEKYNKEIMSPFTETARYTFELN